MVTRSSADPTECREHNCRTEDKVRQERGREGEREKGREGGRERGIDYKIIVTFCDHIQVSWESHTLGKPQDHL